MVVLPTPGSPVTTSTLLVRASRIASRWLSASVSSPRSSTQPTALPASIDGQGSFPPVILDQPIGDGPLGAIEASKKRAIGLADPVGNHGAFRPLEIEGGADQVGRGLEQALGERYQLLGRQPAIPFIHGLCKGERDAGPETDHRGLLDAESHRDCVRRLEADATNVARQAIGVLRHHLHGVRAVGLVDPHGAGRSDAVRMQKHRDLAHHLLLGPRTSNSICANRANAVHFLQTTRVRLDRVEHLLAERPDELLRVSLGRSRGSFPNRGTSRCPRSTSARRS